MPSQSPSIQSYSSTSWHPDGSQSSRRKHDPVSGRAEAGDGFTSDEVGFVVNPPVGTWTPMQDYENIDIGSVNVGPRCITFMGRIVNIYNLMNPTKKPSAAKGCSKLMVADDTGAVTVRLWYADREYNLQLGHLVTIWTVHMSHGEQNHMAPSAAPLFTSIFPERERSCHIMIHEKSDDKSTCKNPYVLKDTHPLPGLMTVKNYIHGGYDVEDCKIVVCVKSIGACKEFTNKNDTTSKLINIGVFDDTAEASLTLYGSVSGSACSWQPYHTILLITSPSSRIDRRAHFRLNANTRIDIDPDMKDAAWLRAFARRLTRKEHINPLFPANGEASLGHLFDCKTAETSELRILYTLADIDDFARSNPRERFMGYISVLITEVNLVSLYRRNMLMCTECCGIPLYANSISAKCKQCDKLALLRINPRVIGPVIDETGQISAGKLILSPAAWEQILGRNAEDLVETDLAIFKQLEQRLLFIRVSMGFGWCLEDTQPEVIETQDEEVANATEAGQKRKRGAYDNDDVEPKADQAIDKGNAQNNGVPKVNSPKTKRKVTFQEGHESWRTPKAPYQTKIKTTAIYQTATNRRSVSYGSEAGRLCIWCVKM